MRARRGFTLIETVVIIGMYAVILLALASLFTTFSRLYRYQQSFVAASQAAGASLAAFHAAIIPASQVLGTYNFASGARSSDATTLVLELPAIDASGQVIDGAYDRIAFYTAGTDLYRLLESAPGSARAAGTKLLMPYTGSLSFSYDDPDFSMVTNVTVDLVASSTMNGQSITTHRHETLYLRN